MGDAHKDRATIGDEVIDPVGNGNADGVCAEVMIIDEVWRATPACSLIFKVADELTLLRIHADDGMIARLETVSHFGDILELLIAVRAGVCGKHLVVDAERVAHLMKQAADSIGGNEDSHFGEKDSNLVGGTPTPFQSGHRIATRVVLEEPFNGGDYLRRFFSTGFRPAPVRRVRPISTSWSSNCCRPRATV